MGFTPNLYQFGSTIVGSHTAPIFTRSRARDLIDQKQHYMVEPPDLSNRIAIIGASYDASGDWHRTPLGRMPGMYVIGNMVAFGKSTLEEHRWWGIKPLVFGVALFSLHLLASLVCRPTVALALIVVASAALLPWLAQHGVSITTAYEAAVVGIGLIALNASVSAAISAFADSGSETPSFPFARLVLSERSLEWLRARANRSES